MKVSAGYRSPWLLVILLVLGGVFGSLVGDVLSGTPALGFLGTARSIGLPVTTLDLDVITLTLGFTVRVNLIGLIGVVLAFLIYRRL